LRGGKRDVVLIAGPTASGKSALALKKAADTNGVIINTDSMQVYDVLRILTARPSDSDLAAAPHRLFGHVHPSEPYSTGRWLADVAQVLDDPDLTDRTLIFAGGTGLYFRALLQGMSPMPVIPEDVRERWRYRLAEEGAQKLHRLLRREDPEAAMAIRSSDGQRIIRALEVIEVAGEPMTVLQSRAGEALVSGDMVAERIVVMPDRQLLYRNIEARLDAMVEEGAVDEVRDLMALDLDPALPAMKAIGVREFASVIRGTSSMEEALAAAKTATRQYAKRQMTWFRNQLDAGWAVHDPSGAEK
jgi:tRNA dimethylallyltransferase